ncbi:UNVERIFIED_CONTAM: polyprotein [Sesamum radiatum]|uniref:Polyprotein n=1 Tax=Sesamum radiatum TaxID=300843 RepID=A0AAW2JM50_SESRA
MEKPEFFIQLPFKLNEDANPIKASHPGMTPDDLVLAREECNQLLALGLIEPTNQIGLVQLSMSTKELNKSEGKRGIDPNDRYKTAFCLPNAQYQWTVMPFGLKVAPSLFQKAMIKIFEPILHTTLIYIDDILLYTQDQPTHAKLLQQFYDIVQAHGVMLSDKKSFIGQPNIDFLGMKFIDGRYQPGPHITQELLKFPEENLTKEIQQFLGIVNYIKDFIPECSRYTSQLSKLLKKEPPPWGQVQTMALQKLKAVHSKTHQGDANLIPDFLSRPSGIHLISPTGTIPIFMASSSGSTSRSPSTFPPGFFHDLKNIREYALDNMFRYLARLLSNTDIPPGRGCFRPDHPFFNVITLPGPGLPEDALWFLWCLAALYYLPIEIQLAQMIDHLRDIKNGKSHIWIFLSWFDDIAAWNKQFQQTLDEGKSYSIIILHRPYYEGTGEAKPLPLCRTWKSLEKPLIEQRHEGQELARHLCFVNKIPTQGLKLVYTSLAIEPMDEDSDDDPMLEPDSQDPWDYGTEINLESPSFYHGGPSTSA